MKINKNYLEQLFSIKFELKEKIARCEASLMRPQMAPCSECGFSSAIEIRAEKASYELAEKYNDAAINFYISMHS